MFRSGPVNHNHVIAIQLQDYFHHKVFQEVIDKKQWNRMESRLQKNVDDLLVFLDKYNIKATFFTIGWIAEKYPDVIRKVAEKGHEIANAGYWGWNFQELS